MSEVILKGPDDTVAAAAADAALEVCMSPVCAYTCFRQVMVERAEMQVVENVLLHLTTSHTYVQTWVVFDFTSIHPFITLMELVISCFG